MIREANILGSTCSRICPYLGLCEKDCKRALIDRPIKIGLLQRFATEYEEQTKLEILQKVSPTKEKIAIIGSGPAGLAASSALAQKGYAVTVFEKDSVIGGVLSKGIIPSRLPQEIVDSEINRIKNLGVEFKAKCEVGKDISVDELKSQGFKAFLIATGNTNSKTLGIPNSDAKGIFTAIDFLSRAKVTNENIVIDKKIVVIGGGDVAIDSSLTAALLSAKKVSILYRRRLQDMPATPEEIQLASDLKLNIYSNFTPFEYSVREGILNGIRAKGTYDASEIFLDADIVIEAIGQTAYDVRKIFSEIELNDKLGIKLTNSRMTSLKGVFAAGDITNGGETVVLAVKEGKEAAEEIDRYLSNKPQSFIIGKTQKDTSLEIEFCGVKCENPFFLSSSPVAHGYDMCASAFKSGWGGAAYKTITKINCDECSPRFDAIGKESTPFIGLKNMEQLSDWPFEKDFDHISKLKKDFPHKVIIASIMGSNENEWTELAKYAEQSGADIIECNFSCPQMTQHGTGSDVGQSPELVKLYSAATRRGTRLPILAKMTPNIGNMEIPAIASIDGGATGIAAINTIKAITAIDIDKFTCLPIVNGKSSISGYSGKAVKPIALRFIAQMLQHTKLKNIPISGMGGIETWKDAVEFFLVGSSNLQVTTSVMQYGYRIIDDLKSGLSNYLKISKFNSIKDIIGLALNNIIPADNLDRDFKIIPKIDLDKCIGCGRCYISCLDGAHQAIDWNSETRKPSINDNCVGCHLCKLVCPVECCISDGEIKFKPGRKPHEVIL